MSAERPAAKVGPAEGGRSGADSQGHATGSVGGANAAWRHEYALTAPARRGAEGGDAE